MNCLLAFLLDSAGELLCWTLSVFDTKPTLNNTVNYCKNCTVSLTFAPQSQTPLILPSFLDMTWTSSDVMSLDITFLIWFRLSYLMRFNLHNFYTLIWKYIPHKKLVIIIIYLLRKYSYQLIIKTNFYDTFNLKILDVFWNG